jgi:hypothetical protein
MDYIMSGAMGAIAVSKEEERRIERLRKELRISTKASLIRVALSPLERTTDEKRLRREIAESVRRCASADRRENLEHLRAGIVRRTARG